MRLKLKTGLCTPLLFMQSDIAVSSCQHSKGKKTTEFSQKRLVLLTVDLATPSLNLHYISLLFPLLKLVTIPT